MNNAQMLIERLRKKVPNHTDYGVSKALEMSQSQLKGVIDGKYGLGPKAVIRLHELLGMDTRDLLVLIEEDKAKTPIDKEFWGRRSPRITAASLATGLALVAAGLGNARTAKALDENTVPALHAIHYAKYKKFLDFLKNTKKAFIDRLYQQQIINTTRPLVTVI